MLNLSSKIREVMGKKTKNLRKKGLLPAVLYGPKVKNLNLELNLKDFEKILKEAGESSLIKLQITGLPAGRQGDIKKDYSVLIHDIERESIKGNPIHVDFYLPPTTEEIVVKVPIIIEGEAPAVKELGGTLIKDIHEIEIKGLLQNLPKEIKVDLSKLKTFSDHILIGDLNLPQGVKTLKDSKEIVISVAPPAKIEEELAKAVEEKVEEVKVVEKEEKEEAAGEEIKK